MGEAATMAHSDEILWRPILGRQRTSSIVDPSHFILGEPSAAPGGDVDHLVYCADYASRRLICTVHDDPKAVLAAPFMYEAQFDDAKAVLTVPFSKVSPNLVEPSASPTFVFSIGRCGSTLVSQLLNAVGVASVSEPDIYSQAAKMSAAGTLPPAEDTAPGFVLNLQRLVRYLGPSPVIKLRSQCNRVPMRILKSAANARTVFILRNRKSWARSVVRAFGAPATRLATDLARAIRTYDLLVQSGRPTALLWYEDIVARPEVVLPAFGVPESSLPPGALQSLSEAAGADSQAGTRLSREALAAREFGPEQLQRFEDAWVRQQPRDLIAKYGLAERL